MTSIEIVLNSGVKNCHVSTNIQNVLKNELHHEKTGFWLMRKQRHRSALQ